MNPISRLLEGNSIKSLLTHPTARQFIQFLVVRGACAMFSYACYLLLLLWFSYETAYVVTYILGIGLAYVSSAAWVFKEPLRRTSALVFPLVYVVQFVLGLLLIKLAVEILGIPESLALAFSIVLTLPLTFVLSRWAVRIG